MALGTAWICPAATKRALCLLEVQYFCRVIFGEVLANKKRAASLGAPALQGVNEENHQNTSTRITVTSSRDDA